MKNKACYLQYEWLCAAGSSHGALFSGFVPLNFYESVFKCERIKEEFLFVFFFKEGREQWFCV